MGRDGNTRHLRLALTLQLEKNVEHHFWKLSVAGYRFRIKINEVTLGLEQIIIWKQLLLEW